MYERQLLQHPKMLYTLQIFYVKSEWQDKGGNEETSIYKGSIINYVKERIKQVSVLKAIGFAELRDSMS